MNDKKAKELADLISFRLLATIKHADYEWLLKLLKKSNEQTR